MQAGPNSRPSLTRKQPEAVSKLSGTWETIRGSVEGLSEFLDVTGVSWAKRKIANTLANKFVQRQEISNDFNSFLVVITNPGGLGVDTKEFVVNGPPFEGTFGPEKKPGTGRAKWEGDTLVFSCIMDDVTTEQRRWLEGELMIQTDKLTTLRNGRSAVLKRKLHRIS
jgi:hypothetical protein